MLAWFQRPPVREEKAKRALLDIARVGHHDRLSIGIAADLIKPAAVVLSDSGDEGVAHTTLPASQALTFSGEPQQITGALL